MENIEKNNEYDNQSIDLGDIPTTPDLYNTQEEQIDTLNNTIDIPIYDNSNIPNIKEPILPKNEPTFLTSEENNNSFDNILKYSTPLTEKENKKMLRYLNQKKQMDEGKLTNRSYIAKFTNRLKKFVSRKSKKNNSVSTTGNELVNIIKKAKEIPDNEINTFVETIKMEKKEKQNNQKGGRHKKTRKLKRIRLQ